MSITAKEKATQRRIDHALGEARRHAIKNSDPLVWALIAIAEEIRAHRLTMRQEIRNAAFEYEDEAIASRKAPDPGHHEQPPQDILSDESIQNARTPEGSDDA